MRGNCPIPNAYEGHRQVIAILRSKLFTMVTAAFLLAGIGSCANAIPAPKTAEEPARISPEGIGSIRFGMSLQEAEQALGGPLRLNLVSPGCWQATSDLISGATLKVTREGVLAAAIFNGLIKTDRGIGLGSSARDLQTEYPGMNSAPDPSSAESTRFIFRSPSGHSAVFTLTDDLVIAMYLGDTASVEGEGPCV